MYISQLLITFTTINSFFSDINALFIQNPTPFGRRLELSIFEIYYYFRFLTSVPTKPKFFSFHAFFFFNGSFCASCSLDVVRMLITENSDKIRTLISKICYLFWLLIFKFNRKFRILTSEKAYVFGLCTSENVQIANTQIRIKNKKKKLTLKMNFFFYLFCLQHLCVLVTNFLLRYILLCFLQRWRSLCPIILIFFKLTVF